MTMPSVNMRTGLSIWDIVMFLMAAAVVVRFSTLNQSSVMADGSRECAIADSVPPLQIALDINNTFGPRILEPGSNTRYDFHRGIDWPAPEGTPVYAVATGTVKSFNKTWTSGTGSGNYVHLIHDSEGCETRYNHLETVDAAIVDNAHVSTGQLIGTVGKTGAQAFHLHFEVRNGTNVSQRTAVHPLSSPFIPWTNATSPRAALIGAFHEGTSVTAIVEVTSPYAEPDIGSVSVDISDGSTFTRTIDFVTLNASTIVVARLDDPLIDDTCIVPYDLNPTDGYRLLLAFRDMTGGSNSTVTVRVSDVGGMNSQTSGVLNNSLQITPGDLEAEAGPGDSVTFTYTLQNNSGVSDTFAISALSAQGWTTTTSVSSLSLVNGQSGQVDVTVTLTTDTFGPPDCGLLMAKSNTNPHRMIAGFFRISRDAHVNGTIGLDQPGRGTTSTPFKTVGYAIDQTDAGGRVNIAQGTYSENIVLGDTIDLYGGYNSDFSSRTLAQDATVLDGSGTGGVLEVSGDYGPIIDGLTLKNGLRSGGGGGLRIVGGAAPTVQNNWIVNNTSTVSGGGIYVGSSGEFAPTIKDNTISNNISQSTSGGGGGIYVTGRPAIIQGNEISGNQAAGNSGGGVYLTGDTPAQLLGNRILNNTAVDDGGGVNIRSGNVYAANNVIRGNSAGDDGNGIAVSNSSNPTIQNNTVVANNPSSGVGIYASTGAMPNLSNNIISGHAIGVRCGSTFEVRYSILFNDDNASESCTLVNVIQADPKLTDEFHIGPDSPAIDAGESVSTVLLTDIDGDPRVTDGDCNGTKTIDIGADESMDCSPSTVPGLSLWGILTLGMVLITLSLRRLKPALGRRP